LPAVFVVFVAFAFAVAAQTLKGGLGAQSTDFIAPSPSSLGSGLGLG